MPSASVKEGGGVAEIPWYAGFPEPLSNIKSIERRALIQLLQSVESKKDFVLVDLRRDDYKASKVYLAFSIFT